MNVQDLKRKGRMNRKLMMMHICRFVILAKQTQREFDFVNKHIASVMQSWCAEPDQILHISQKVRAEIIRQWLTSSVTVKMLSPDNDSMMDVGIFIAENPMAGSYDGLIVKPIFSRIPFANFLMLLKLFDL